MTDQRPLAVFDIDGVLADVRHRLHHLKGKPKNWKGFFADSVKDRPYSEGLEYYKTLKETHEVVFLTGRPESCRRDTLLWLEKHGLEGELYMRNEQDRRPASMTKAERSVSSLKMTLALWRCIVKTGITCCTQPGLSQASF